MKDELTNHLVSVSKDAETLLNKLMKSYKKEMKNYMKEIKRISENENYTAISRADTLIAPFKHSMNTILSGNYQDEGLQTVLKLMKKNLWGLLCTSKLTCKEKRDVLFIIAYPKVFRRYKLRKKRKF